MPFRAQRRQTRAMVGPPGCGTLPGNMGLKLQPPASRQEKAKVAQLSRGKHLHSHR